MIKIVRALMLIVILNITSVLAQATFAHENDPVLFAIITAEDWCATCQKLKPVVEELEYEYYGRVEFVKLDASSKYALEDAKRVADEKNIGEFFESHKTSLPTVGIFCPGGKKLEKSFIGETRKEAYKEALDVLLFDTPRICSL